jgi:hypothetical protein
MSGRQVEATASPSIPRTNRPVGPFINSVIAKTPPIAYNPLSNTYAGAVYRRNSAVTGVADITTPVLLQQGSDDSTIPWRPAQKPIPASVNFARALDQEYKIFRHKAYSAGSYYISGRENTIQKLIDMEAFFGQFLGSAGGMPDSP